jgi:hypothetical protein
VSDLLTEEGRVVKVRVTAGRLHEVRVESVATDGSGAGGLTCPPYLIPASPQLGLVGTTPHSVNTTPPSMHMDGSFKYD